MISMQSFLEGCTYGPSQLQVTLASSFKQGKVSNLYRQLQQTDWYVCIYRYVSMHWQYIDKLSWESLVLDCLHFLALEKNKLFIHHSDVFKANMFKFILQKMASLLSIPENKKKDFQFKMKTRKSSYYYKIQLEQLSCFIQNNSFSSNLTLYSFVKSKKEVKQFKQKRQKQSESQNKQQYLSSQFHQREKLLAEYTQLTKIIREKKKINTQLQTQLSQLSAQKSLLWTQIKEIENCEIKQYLIIKSKNKQIRQTSKILEEAQRKYSLTLGKSVLLNMVKKKFSYLRLNTEWYEADSITSKQKLQQYLIFWSSLFFSKVLHLQFLSESQADKKILIDMVLSVQFFKQILLPSQEPVVKKNNTKDVKKSKVFQIKSKFLTIEILHDIFKISVKNLERFQNRYLWMQELQVEKNQEIQLTVRAIYQVPSFRVTSELIFRLNDYKNKSQETGALNSKVFYSLVQEDQKFIELFNRHESIRFKREKRQIPKAFLILWHSNIKKEQLHRSSFLHAMIIAFSNYLTTPALRALLRPVAMKLMMNSSLYSYVKFKSFSRFSISQADLSSLKALK